MARAASLKISERPEEKKANARRHTDRRSGRSGKPQKPSLASGGSAPTPLKRQIGICNKSRSPPFCVPDMISNWQGALSEPDQGRPLEKKRNGINGDHVLSHQIGRAHV